jgi:hypothetical protein
VDTIAHETVTVPKEEYRVLKEIYQSVKRQNFLLRIAEAERNLKAGKVKREKGLSKNGAIQRRYL